MFYKLNCYKHKGIRLVTQLCLELSDIHKHKFNHTFQNCISPFCSCVMDVESTSHFFLHCPLKNHSPEHTRKTDCKLTVANKSS